MSSPPEDGSPLEEADAGSGSADPGPESLALEMFGREPKELEAVFEQLRARQKAERSELFLRPAGEAPDAEFQGGL